MSDESNPERGRSVGLTVLRAAALSLSVAVVGVLMLRASGGCTDKSDIGAEPARSAEDIPATAGATAAATASGPRDVYLMGSKAPAGLIEVDTDASAAAPPPSSQPAAGTSVKEPELDPDPTFFPATKSGRPIPPRKQQQNPPAQAQQPSQSR